MFKWGWGWLLSNRYCETCIWQRTKSMASINFTFTFEFALSTAFTKSLKSFKWLLGKSFIDVSTAAWKVSALNPINKAMLGQCPSAQCHFGWSDIAHQKWMSGHHCANLHQPNNVRPTLGWRTLTLAQHRYVDPDECW